MKQSFLVSVVAHILVLAFLALWPRTGEPRRVTTITIQRIELKRPPEPVLKSQPPQPEVKPPEPQPRVKPPDNEIARLLRDRLKNRQRTPKPVPTSRPNPVRQRRTPTPVESRPTQTPSPTPVRRATYTRITDVETPTKTPISQVDEAEPADEQEVVFEEGFNYGAYTDRLVRILQRNWDPPAWQPSRGDGIYAMVRFTIQSNGMVVNVEIETPSGWQELDDSALRAVRKSNPVEPLPSEYGRPSVRAHVRFRPIPR